MNDDGGGGRCSTWNLENPIGSADNLDPNDHCLFLTLSRTFPSIHCSSLNHITCYHGEGPVPAGAGILYFHSKMKLF